MVIRTGSANDRQQPRQKLVWSEWQGRNKSSMQASDERSEDTAEATPLQQLENRLWQERNVWDIKRRSLPADADSWMRGGGFAGRGKLSAEDADRLLRQGFRAIDQVQS